MRLRTTATLRRGAWAKEYEQTFLGVAQFAHVASKATTGVEPV
jgi:hypothetical protein